MCSLRAKSCVSSPWCTVSAARLERCKFFLNRLKTTSESSVVFGKQVWQSTSRIDWVDRGVVGVVNHELIEKDRCKKSPREYEAQ